MKKYIYPLVIALFIMLLYQMNTFYMIENNLTDRLTSSQREADSRLVVLGIDDRSVNETGKWPWPREVLANVVEQLAQAGATAVFVDVLYTDPSQNPGDDAAWEAVVRQYDNVYLPAYFHFHSRQSDRGALSYESLERPVYPLNEEQIGHINFLEGRDRVVRRVLLGVPDEAGNMIPAMSVRLANQLLPGKEQVRWNEEGWFRGEQRIPVNQRNEASFLYATAPQDEKGFQYFSVQRLINGEIDPLYFQNTVVLIGPYTVGLQDMYYTPMSKTLRMFGVEIHANVVQALLDGAFYQVLPKGYGHIVILLLTLLSYMLMQRVRAKWATGIFFSVVVIYSIAFVVWFEFQQVVLPYFYPLLALLFAYITSVVVQYLQERMERSRITGIFGRYVSRGVVDEILQSDQEIKLGGIRRDVTLVFVDIRGFTTLSEQIEPEEVIQILNEYLDLCTRAVFEFEGTLDKFIGDGVMAIFGAPIAQEDHAHRAVRAALRMKEGAGELAEKLEERYGRSVSFGIGINSGPAVIGNIGSQDRLDYTAIGDTVNLAARLESNAKPGQILISEQTFERVKDDFTIQPLEEIKVKGKEKPVMIYQVEEESK